MPWWRLTSASASGCRLIIPARHAPMVCSESRPVVSPTEYAIDDPFFFGMLVLLSRPGPPCLGLRGRCYVPLASPLMAPYGIPSEEYTANNGAAHADLQDSGR